MRRVVILGSVGAGKSVLATSISRRTGLPVVHLDVLFWRHGWTPAPREEGLRDFAAAVAGDRWILDGNFLAEENGDEDPRFERADTVIFLDVSRTRCLWRVLKRVVRDRGRSRSDLPEGCSEGVDLSLLGWIWRYPRAERPRVLRILARLDHGVDVRHLRSRSDVQRLLDTLDGPVGGPVLAGART
jgi:adenylate kinase family enzyme